MASEEPAGTPIQKGGDHDVSNGPVKNRRCTDILFCLLFLGHIGLFFALGIKSTVGGNPERLVAGQDWQGHFCGIEGQRTNANDSLVTYPLIYYAMNVTPVVEKVAGALFGSGASSSMSPAALEAQASALLNPQALFTGESSSLVSQISQYFNPVCVTTCPGAVDTNVTTEFTTGMRTYVWEGPVDPTMQSKWTSFKSAADADTSGALWKPFTFKALPFSLCPYEPKFCVPLQLVEVAPLMERYCVPKVAQFEQGIAAAKSLVPDEFGSTISSGFGGLIGDLKTSWPATLITAFVALVVGMIFLFILRLCVGVFVWITIGLCFIVIVAGATIGLLYANKCNGSSLAEFAQTTAITISSGSSAENLILGNASCVNGYSIADPNLRKAVMYTSWGVYGIAGIYLLLVICLCKRIRLGIAINKVAAQFLMNNKSILFVPLIQILLSVAWWAIWIALILFVISKVPEDRTKAGIEYQDYATAATPQQCGYAEMVYLKRVDYAYKPPMSIFACLEPRYYVDGVFAFLFFSLLWVNAFVIDVGQGIIAGAVGVWYFTPNDRKGSLGLKAVRTGTFNALFYHLGTFAFGSLILAIVQFIKWWLRYLAQQAKQTRNKIMEIVCKVLSYVVACFERCIKFLNKNSYIQTALMGTKFCTSAKNAFFLILRNALRIGALGGIGNIINFLGVLFITAVTALIGWLIVTNWFDGQLTSPLFPLIIYVIIGYVVSRLVMSVFSMAVDCVLQCFVADEEINKNSSTSDVTPPILLDFLANQK